MYSKIKTLYYCDFCGKKGMQKSKILKHEEHCTLNKNRKCRLCNNSHSKQVEKWLSSIKTMDREYLDSQEFITDLVKDIDCPNCVLTVLRCSDTQNYNYDYKKELKEFWEVHNKEETAYEGYLY